MTKPRFAGVGLFADQSDATRNLVLEVTEEADHHAGAVILEQGRPVDCVRVIVEGEVLVSRSLPDGSQVSLCTLGPGALFGARSVLDGADHGARCVAVTAVCCAEIPAEAFRELMASSTTPAVRFQQSVVRALFRDLRTANQRVAELAGAGGDEVDLVELDEVFEQLDG